MTTKKEKESREEKAKHIGQQILEQFQSFYFLSFKEVLFEQAQKEHRKVLEEKLFSPRVEKAGGTPKRLRKQEIDSDKPYFAAKIICSESVFTPAGPYIAYVIHSRLGNDSAIVYRRFKQFQELNKFVDTTTKKKKVPKLPEKATSKLESRNLKSEFIQTRSQLLNEYLKAVNENPELIEIKEIQNWLGLGINRNPVLEETVKKTFFRLKLSTNIWLKIIADRNLDTLFKLVCEKIREEVFPELLGASTDLPQKGEDKVLTKLRDGYKSVCDAIGIEVDNLAKVINDRVAEVKSQVVYDLSNSYPQIESLEVLTSGRARQVVTEIFDLSWPEIKKEIKVVQQATQPHIFQLVQKFTAKSSDLDAKVIEILSTGHKMDEFEMIFGSLKQAVKSQLTIQFAESMDHVAADLKSKVSHEGSRALLNSLKLLPDIIGAVTDLMNPQFALPVVRLLLDCKGSLLKEHPVNIKKIEQILDLTEKQSVFTITHANWGLECAGYYSYYELWDLMRNSGPYAELYKTLMFDIHAANKQILSKLVLKFTDIVCEVIQKEVRDWKDALDGATVAAYQATKKSAAKHLKGIFSKFVVALLQTSLYVPVQKIVLAGLSKTTAVPKPYATSLDPMFDQENIYDKVLQEVLRDNLTKLVEEDQTAVDFGLFCNPTPATQ